MEKLSLWILTALGLFILANCNTKTPDDPVPPTTTNNVFCIPKETWSKGTLSVLNRFNTQHYLISSRYYGTTAVNIDTFMYSANKVEYIGKSNNKLHGKTVYYLDANGRTTKSIHELYGSIPPTTTPDAVDTTYYYYDNAGFLLSEYSVWEHYGPGMYNAYDTVFYTISNENVTKKRRRGSAGMNDSLIIEYTNLPATTDVLQSVFIGLSPINGMFGKTSKNLPSKLYLNPSQLYPIAYTFDNTGLPTQVIMNADTSTIVSYECL